MPEIPSSAKLKKLFSSQGLATISNIFDADVVQQQIYSSKDQIASQIATSMLSQMNSAPQNLLTLFR